MTLLRRDPQTRGNLEVYNSFPRTAKRLLGTGLSQSLVGLGLGFRVLGCLFQSSDHRCPVVEPEFGLGLGDDEVGVTLVLNTFT